MSIHSLLLGLKSAVVEYLEDRRRRAFARARFADGERGIGWLIERARVTVDAVIILTGLRKKVFNFPGSHDLSMYLMIRLRSSPSRSAMWRPRGAG